MSDTMGLTVNSSSSSKSPRMVVIGDISGITLATWIGTIRISVPSPSSSKTCRVARCIPDVLYETPGSVLLSPVLVELISGWCSASGFHT